MDMEGNHLFKVYLKRDDEFVIRQFTILKNLSNNFLYFENKIRSLFPEVNKCNFVVMWKDGEDMIHISSDSELILALHEMNEPVKKIYINLVGRHYKLLKEDQETGEKKHSVEFKIIRKNNATNDGKRKPIPVTSVITVKNKHSRPVQTLNKMSQKKDAQTVTEVTKMNSRQTETNNPFVFSESIEVITHNIELIRSHLINPDGSVSDNLESSKLQSLELTLRKLQCVVDKLKHTEVPATIVDSIILPVGMGSNISDVQKLHKCLKIQDNDLPASAENGVGSKQGVERMDVGELVDDHEKSEVENGSSVKTLSLTSSDDEGDMWTMLDHENPGEADSLPDVSGRLAALRANTCSEDTQTAREEQQITSTLPSPSTFEHSTTPATVCETETAESETNPTEIEILPVPTEVRSMYPHIAVGLEILLSMGFVEENHKLLDLLERFDGDVVAVLDNILFTDP